MTIDVSTRGEGVALVTFNRPDKRNALTQAMRELLVHSLERLAADEETKVVVLAGTGSTFCAGFDLAEMRGGDPPTGGDRMASSDRFHHAIMDFPLPIIAAVNGPALAAGFDIAVLTDLRIGSETARFAHPEHAWGEVIYRPLWDLVGGSLARDLVLTGRSIDAREALAAGLVNQVVPQPETIPTASQVATTIAQAPRHVLQHMKAKFLAARGISPDTGTLDL